MDNNHYQYKFNGNFSEYPNFVDIVSQRLGSKGKNYILSPSTHRPKKPRRSANEKIQSQYDTKLRAYKVDCEIALSTITSLLGPAPLARVQFIVHDRHDRSDREKCVDILAQLKLEYVPPTNITADLFKSSIEAIPTIDPLCSRQEAANQIENIMTVMTTQSALLELHHYKSRIHHQVDLIRTFYSKANHEIIEAYKTLQINETTNGKKYTFSLLCREIRSQLIGKKLLTDTAPILSPTAPAYIPVRTFSADTSSSIQASAAAAQSRSSPSNSLSPSKPFEMRPCYNCQGIHKNADCNAALCRNCNKIFKSTSDPAYHHFTTCSQRNIGTAKRNLGNNPPRYDRPKFRKANTALDETQQWGDSDFDSEDSFYCNMICGDVSDEDDVPDLVSDCSSDEDDVPDLVSDCSSDEDDAPDLVSECSSDDEEYEKTSLRAATYNMSDAPNDQCNMICNEPTQPDLSLGQQHLQASSSPMPLKLLAMVDSGTNVKVCSYSFPALLNIPVQKYPRRKRILFGNNSVSYSEHFAYFGPLIGKVSLLEGASDFLLSVEHFTSKSIMILFQEDKVYFLNSQFKIITSGNNTVDSSRLYYVNILPLINFDTLDPEKFTDHAISMVNSRKLIPVKEQQVKEVMDLHKRLNHPGTQTMIAAIKNHTWLK
jgi:hypothetical protein